MAFQIALYEYPVSEDQFDDTSSFPSIRRTRVWDNFAKHLVPIAGRNWFATRDKCLREEYNAHISYDSNIGQLVFETEQDMLLFLLRWS